MRFFHVLYFFLFSAAASAEQVCLKNEELQLLTTYHRMVGESQQSILYNIQATELGLQVIDKIDEQHQKQIVDHLDRMQVTYFERILLTIDILSESGVEFSLYENRLSSALDRIVANGQFYPVTLDSSAFLRIREQVDQKLLTSKASPTR